MVNILNLYNAENYSLFVDSMSINTCWSIDNKYIPVSNINRKNHSSTYKLSEVIRTYFYNKFNKSSKTNYDYKRWRSEFVSHLTLDSRQFLKLDLTVGLTNQEYYFGKGLIMDESSTILMLLTFNNESVEKTSHLFDVLENTEHISDETTFRDGTKIISQMTLLVNKEFLNEKHKSTYTKVYKGYIAELISAGVNVLYTNDIDNLVFKAVLTGLPSFETLEERENYFESINERLNGREYADPREPERVRESITADIPF